VHRDVKPDNILYDRQGFVYLSDFGIAKKIEIGPDTLPVEGETPATTFGHVIGTPGYIPPEAVSRDYTAGYDQYSLAVVVAQALSGGRPKAEGAASRVKELLPAVPRALRKPLLRALAGDPKHRFPSCLAFAEALRSEAIHAGRRRRAVWTAAVFVLLAGSAASWLFLSRHEDGGTGATTGTGTQVVDPGDPVVEEDPGAPPLDTTPRAFSLGSTPPEREEALALCREIGDACPPELLEGEEVREATLAPFALDPREVTRGEFAAFIGSRPTRAEREGSYDVFDVFVVRDPALSWRTPGWPEPRDDQPVVHVSRAEAADYCESVGARLPTEDEWEATTRGDARRIFPWGNAWEQTRARWFGNDEVRNPAPVAQFDPAPEGFYDLAGNVWEWTSTRENGRDVAKGGSFADSNPVLFRGAARQVPEEAGYTSIDIGFRCARDLQAWPTAE
jgi:formylglycine-generating enzyme required for sulfatase activity